MLKNTYKKPEAQMYDVNSSGFVASGGACIKIEEQTTRRWKTNHFEYTSSGKTVSSLPELCWHWTGNQSF